MISINPYLNFAGNAEEVFNFYKSVFGGDFAMLQRFKDVEGLGNLPANEVNRVMHVSLPMGQSMLMASDTLESLGQQVTFGNNFYISINAESKEEADRLFAGLSAGGHIEMPMQDQFWGAYFGMCKDKFGIQWMLSFNQQQA